MSGVGAGAMTRCPKCGLSLGTIEGASLHVDGCPGPVRPPPTAADLVTQAYLEVVEDLAARDELEERAALARRLAGGGW